MSERHDEVFRAIRLEHADAVAALKKAKEGKKRGAFGVPAYDPARLEAAIATADDAYALLLIANAEAYLREYLVFLRIGIGEEPRLSMLIDKSTKEINHRSIGIQIRPADKIPMHNLRVSRNTYAHGHGRNVFPSVPKVEAIVSRFLSPFP